MSTFRDAVLDTLLPGVSGLPAGSMIGLDASPHAEALREIANEAGGEASFISAPVDKRAEILATAQGAHLSREDAAAFVAANVAAPLAPEVHEAAVDAVVRQPASAWRDWLTAGSLEDATGLVGVLDLPVVVLAGTEDDALGAETASVLRLVLNKGLVLAGVGIALGIGGALALGKLVATQLFQTRAADPTVFAVVSAGLVVVALLATLLPARRATRVDPMVALRSE